MRSERCRPWIVSEILMDGDRHSMEGEPTRRGHSSPRAPRDAGLGRGPLLRKSRPPLSDSEAPVAISCQSVVNLLCASVVVAPVGAVYG